MDKKDQMDKPDYVISLEEAYGVPSQEGFGSAVFFEVLDPIEVTLEGASLEKYKYFVGDNWKRFGEDAWMSSWQEVYARETEEEHDIVAELQGIKDRGASLSVSMILENVEDSEKARAALAEAYDDPAVDELSVYTIGDGDAMSGLLVAGCRAESGETTFLTFLLD